MATVKKRQIKLKRAPSLSEQVSDYLMDEMARGALKPGDKLPAEAYLAEQLGVSRIVIREAFSSLRYDGRIETRHGQGAFVTETHHHRAFRLDHLETAQPDDLRQLFELRAILESSAAALAARRRSHADLTLLDGYIRKMADAIAEERDGVIPDMRFHQHLAAASGNTYLRDFMHFLGGRLQALINQARGNTEQTPGLPQQVQKEHQAIFEAVHEGLSA